MEYRYTSTEERVYADRGLVANIGDVADWPDGAPADGHWQPVTEQPADAEQNTETPVRGKAAPKTKE